MNRSNDTCVRDVSQVPRNVSITTEKCAEKGWMRAEVLGNDRARIKSRPKGAETKEAEDGKQFQKILWNRGPIEDSQAWAPARISPWVLATFSKRMTYCEKARLAPRPPPQSTLGCLFMGHLRVLFLLGVGSAEPVMEDIAGTHVVALEGLKKGSQ